MSSAAAAPIGLSWAPQLPSLAAAGGSKKGSAPTPSIDAQESLWKPSNELVDGLYVPPRDPRKVNKMARKNVKDTTGKGWWVEFRLWIRKFSIGFLDGWVLMICCVVFQVRHAGAEHHSRVEERPWDFAGMVLHLGVLSVVVIQCGPPLCNLGKQKNTCLI